MQTSDIDNVNAAMLGIAVEKGVTADQVISACIKQDTCSINAGLIVVHLKQLQDVSQITFFTNHLDLPIFL